MGNLNRVDHQKTKIVATVGPASRDYNTLLNLVKAGTDVFRLNFSHGTHQDHLETINNIISICENYDVYVGIMADLQGPKLRVGEIQGGILPLEKDDIITFTNTPCIGTKEGIYMSYENLASDVRVGQRVLVDDGRLVLEVVSTNDKDEVNLKVKHGNAISSNKGVNLPDTEVSLPSLTEKDRKDLEFILSQPVNWIALSFVRKAEDIANLKNIIIEHSHYAKTIAKIEKPEAVHNIKSIIREADGIMIARGDLGIEYPMEKLPPIQKNIIKKCLEKAKPVIVATQMMESMIKNPLPTRPEITDVANAVLDGCDAVMLSGETAVGDHPLLVVQTMNKIISEAENHYQLVGKRPKANKNSDTYYSDTICINAAKIAEEIKAKAILGITVSGYTAFKVSSYRPKSKIFIFSSVRPVLGTFNLIWGVKPFYYDKFTSTDETIEDLVEILKGKKLLKEGDVIINTASMPLHKRFRTNMLKITLVD